MLKSTGVLDARSLEWQDTWDWGAIVAFLEGPLRRVKGATEATLRLGPKFLKRLAGFFAKRACSVPLLSEATPLVLRAALAFGSAVTRSPEGVAFLGSDEELLPALSRAISVELESESASSSSLMMMAGEGGGGGGGGAADAAFSDTGRESSSSVSYDPLVSSPMPSSSSFSNPALLHLDSPSMASSSSGVSVRDRGSRAMPPNRPFHPAAVDATAGARTLIGIIASLSSTKDGLVLLDRHALLSKVESLLLEVQHSSPLPRLAFAALDFSTGGAKTRRLLEHALREGPSHLRRAAHMRAAELLMAQACEPASTTKDGGVTEWLLNLEVEACLRPPAAAGGAMRSGSVSFSEAPSSSLGATMESGGDISFESSFAATAAAERNAASRVLEGVLRCGRRWFRERAAAAIMAAAPWATLNVALIEPYPNLAMALLATDEGFRMLDTNGWVATALDQWEREDRVEEYPAKATRAMEAVLDEAQRSHERSSSGVQSSSPMPTPESGAQLWDKVAQFPAHTTSGLPSHLYGELAATSAGAALLEARGIPRRISALLDNDRTPRGVWAANAWAAGWIAGGCPRAFHLARDSGVLTDLIAQAEGGGQLALRGTALLALTVANRGRACRHHLFNTCQWGFGVVPGGEEAGKDGEEEATEEETEEQDDEEMQEARYYVALPHNPARLFRVASAKLIAIIARWKRGFMQRRGLADDSNLGMQELAAMLAKQQAAAGDEDEGSPAAAARELFSQIAKLANAVVSEETRDVLQKMAKERRNQLRSEAEALMESLLVLITRIPAFGGGRRTYCWRLLESLAAGTATGNH